MTSTSQAAREAIARCRSVKPPEDPATRRGRFAVPLPFVWPLVCPLVAIFAILKVR
jgi:hypothetical protein